MSSTSIEHSETLNHSERPLQQQSAVAANLIHAETLRHFRIKRGWNQQQLADAVKCTKDTVSRWERGVSRRVRSHLRDPLCRALRVDWQQLTNPINRTHGKVEKDMTTLSVGRDVRNNLQIVAARYEVRVRDVLAITPLLFYIIAELSLMKRAQRLDEIRVTLEEAEDKLLARKGHLGGNILAGSIFREDELIEEEESLKRRDIFGRTITYSQRHKHNDGPFVHFVRELVDELPEESAAKIESYFGDVIDFYQIAEDTLRELTCATDDERCKALRHYIRRGRIDLSECLRKRAENEIDYQMWLDQEFARIAEADNRSLRRRSANGSATSNIR